MRRHNARAALWRLSNFRLVVTYAGLIALVSLSLSSTPVAATSTTAESGLWGGGLTTVLSIDPNSSTNILVGGDVSGVHRSTSSADSWTTSDANMWDPVQRGIATIAYSEANSSTVYAGLGNGSAGGVLKSTNGGQTWTQASTTPVFDALSSSGGPFGSGSTQVRSLGNLIVVDDTNGIVYAGTYKGGVYGSTNGGGTWSPIALAPGDSHCTDWGQGRTCYIRTLLAQPDDPTTLYVGTFGDGGFKITNANSSTRQVTSLGMPSGTHAEEFVFDNATPTPRLWCACGDDGIFRASSPYTSWSSVNGSGIETTGPEWNAIAFDPVQSEIYVGATQAVDDGAGHYKSLKKRTGTSWTDITTDPSKISNTVCGTTSTDWWLGDSTGAPDYVLGAQAYDPAMIVANDDNVYVAGKSGVWRSTDGGTGGTTDWSPCVQGLGVTVNNDLGTSPNDPANAYIVDQDWTFLYSEDHGATVARHDPSASEKTGVSMAVDVQDGSVSDAYLGIGDTAQGPTYNTAGDVFMSSDPTSSSWTSLDLRSATMSPPCPTGVETAVPLGMAVGRDISGTVFVVAAVNNCGVWRYDSSTDDWTQEEGITVFGPQDNITFAPMAWPGGTGPYVYLLNRSTQKLYYSDDYGQSWSQLWSVPGGTMDNSTGYLAADPVVTGRLWVTTNETKGTYRLDGVQDGVIDCTTHYSGTSDPSNPGPVIVRPGASTVYVATRASQTVTAVALVRTSPGTTGCPKPATWTNVTTGNTTYQGAARFPGAMAAVPDGTTNYLYVAPAGAGVLVVTDS